MMSVNMIDMIRFFMVIFLSFLVFMRIVYQRYFALGMDWICKNMDFLTRGGVFFNFFW